MRCISINADFLETNSGLLFDSPENTFPHRSPFMWPSPIWDLRHPYAHLDSGHEMALLSGPLEGHFLAVIWDDVANRQDLSDRSTASPRGDRPGHEDFSHSGVERRHAKTPRAHRYRPAMCCGHTTEAAPCGSTLPGGTCGGAADNGTMRAYRGAFPFVQMAKV